MRARLGRLPAVGTALFAILVAGCQNSDSSENAVTPPPPTQSISLSISNISLVINQSLTSTTSATVARNNGYAGTVSLSVEGAPPGVTPSFNPATLSAGTSSSALSLAVAPTAPLGTSTLTIRASGAGVSDDTKPLELTIVPLGSFILSVAPSPLIVSQGSANSATVTITRTGAFSGAVTLSVSGAPAGMTATPALTTVSGSSTTVTVAAAASVAPGTYPLVAHGTAVGQPEQTAAFNVQVTSLPQNSLTLQFCGATIPIWVAGQSDGGAWMRLTGSNGAFTMSIGTRGAIALVEATHYGTYETTIAYGSASELTVLGNSLAAFCAKPVDGSRHLTGSLAGIGSGQRGEVAIGSAMNGQNFDGPFDIYHAPDVPSDLAATRVTETVQGYTTDRMILRRDVSAPSESMLPVLDFLGTESFTPATATATIGGLNGDELLMDATLYAGGNTVATLSDYMGTSPAPFAGVGALQLRANDLHELFVVAAASGASNAGRGAFSYFRAATNQTITLGPAMSPVVVKGLSSGAPYRFEMQSDWQSAYGNNFTARFQDDANDVIVYATPAYFGGAVVTWHVSIPDMSAAGYDAAWGLHSPSAYWSGLSSNANSLATIFGSTLSESSSYIFGARLSTGASVAAKRTLVAKLARGVRRR